MHTHTRIESIQAARGNRESNPNNNTSPYQREPALAVLGKNLATALQHAVLRQHSRAAGLDMEELAAVPILQSLQACPAFLRRQTSRNARKGQYREGEARPQAQRNKATNEETNKRIS